MKILLVDDHILFVEGLQYLLETYGIDVVGRAKNGKEAITKARVLKPDVILMDIKMPECDGLDALKLIKAEIPDIKILMLTTSEEEEDLYNAIKIGASGYLFKNTDARKLIDMIQRAQNGEVLLPSGIAARMLKEYRHNSDINQNKDSDLYGCNQLTDKQLKVLEMISAGKTYKEAGEVLGLKERTVKYHMGRIIELLHLENKSQVIAYAAQKGLLENENN